MSAHFHSHLCGCKATEWLIFMQVLQVCAYGADYPGNFIASLEALEQMLAQKEIQTIYAFVGRAELKDWCQKIQKRTKVYFLPEAKARILPATYQKFRQIYQENHIDIVHTHFELYDIPATLTAPRNVKIFWHLHDPIDLGKGMRKILWKLQYGIVGKRAQLLAVSDYYRNIVVGLGFPKNQTHIILNCINLDRIENCSVATDKKYDFLTFGWDFYRKGDDLILQVCDRLEKEGYSFRLLLNGNNQTWKNLDDYLNGRTPSYLMRGEPVENVNVLFSESKVFIQASRRETFSYAVCEATYAGLPTISSDIAGLEWAHELPTVEFFMPESVESLYQIMKQYLKGKGVTRQAINKSRKIICNRYSLGVWVRKVIEAYDSTGLNLESKK